MKNSLMLIALTLPILGHAEASNTALKFNCVVKAAQDTVIAKAIISIQLPKRQSGAEGRAPTDLDVSDIKQTETISDRGSTRYGTNLKNAYLSASRFTAIFYNGINGGSINGKLSDGQNKYSGTLDCTAEETESL